MPLPDPLWSYFNQLGHVTGYKQKRSECKECKQQINKSLRSARNHLKKCTKITLAQKRICLGDLYEESDDDSTTLAPEQNSKDDYISKAEQKSLELAFARLIFRCGLFLSLSELEPVKLLLIKLLHI